MHEPEQVDHPELRQKTYKIILKVWLPLEPGIDSPYIPKTIRKTPIPFLSNSLMLDDGKLLLFQLVVKAKL